MSQTTRNFIIGLTAIGGLVGLTALLMFFGELDALTTPRYLVTIDATHAAGLRAGSPVELYGVPIGVVHRIETTDDARHPVRLAVLVEQHVRVPGNVLPFAAASLLGGSATLQLEVPRGAPDAAPLPTDGTARLDGEIKIRLIEEISQELDSRLGPLVDGLGDFGELAKNLNDLVKPPDPADPGRTRNLHTAVEVLNDALVEIRDALALAKAWLGDDQLRTDARTGVANANILIEQATRTLDQFSRTAARLETDSEAITERLLPALDGLAVTLEDIRIVARRATEGEGTIAQLFNNPDLYNSLNDAALRLERALIEVQMLTEKFRAEGVIVQW